MSENHLIKGCIRKDASCQRKLYEQYAGKMMMVCRRYAIDICEAEDMLQEAFVRIFTYIHQYKGEGVFEGWMRRIVVNVALKYLQKKKLNFSEIEPEHIDVKKELEPYVYSSLSEEELLKLINALPDGYRIVFNLYVIEGYNHEDIAKLLNIHPGTSRSQLAKARRLLQEQIIQMQKIAV